MLDASICCLHFEYMHICVWAFPLRCYYFFCLCYYKMSVAIFLHVVFWHFTSCLHIRRTNSFICLRAYFFAFLRTFVFEFTNFYEALSKYRYGNILILTEDTRFAGRMFCFLHIGLNTDVVWCFRNCLRNPTLR